jgi:hypothetical protein
MILPGVLDSHSLNFRLKRLGGQCLGANVAKGNQSDSSVAIFYLEK